MIVQTAKEPSSFILDGLEIGFWLNKVFIVPLHMQRDIIITIIITIIMIMIIIIMQDKMV